MRSEPQCPRCGADLRPPGLWSSAWQCDRHGSVHPLSVCRTVNHELLDHVRREAAVPVWAPWPLPSAWVLSGLAHAGDERTGARAVVVACSGAHPLGGAAELLLVSEEPGVGLGARYAGLAEPDPGDGFDAGPPHAKVVAAGHPTALWALPTAEDRAVFVGEAKGNWLWVLLWPGSAGVFLYDEVRLADLAERSGEVELAFGSLSPRLAPPRAA